MGYGVVDSAEKRRLKAQVSAITIVVITGIGISLATAAYMWGAPLIQKRITMTDYLSTLGFIDSLDGKITGIAGAQSGQASIDIPHGIVTIVPWDAVGPDNNSIIIEFITLQPLTINGSIYLDTRVLGEPAAFGEAEPRIITMEGEFLGTGRNLLTFKMQFRELDADTAPKKGYKIMLNNITKRGTDRITVSFDDTRDQNPEKISGGAMNGGDLFLTYINVFLE